MWTRSASRVAERCSRKKPPDDREAATNEESGAFGSRFFMGGKGCDSLACHQSLELNPPMDSRSLITYWYFHLPNFVLAVVMYTLLARVLLGLFVDADSPNYIWRFFCRLTDPMVAAIALVTPKATAPVVIWLFGVVWLFWLRVGLLYVFLLMGAVPRTG
jgi:hypothetical protein